MNHQDVLSTQQWQARLLEQGIAQLGQAMMIVSCRGEVIFSSKSADEIIKNQLGLSVKDGKLMAELEPDNVRLQEAIQTAIKEEDEAKSVGVYIHRNGCVRPIYMTISRMSKAEQERRQGHHVLILIKDLNLNQAFWADRLKEEYKLSGREMQCVSLLSEGRELKDVAELMEIGIETVRQYMKNIYKKMGVHKQHELVSLALEYRRNR